MHPHTRTGLLTLGLVLGLPLWAQDDEPKTGRVPPSSEKASRTILTTDWPRWRGPNADGVADGRNLPVHWSQTENIRWPVKLPGWGTSSPVVYGKRVFVTSQLQES